MFAFLGILLRSGKYALLNGVSAATKHFSRQFKGLRESTVHSIRSAYKVELERKRKQLATDDSSDDEVCSLPERKRGRKVILGEDLDSKVQKYLCKVRDGGGVVSARIAIAAARACGSV